MHCSKLTSLNVYSVAQQTVEAWRIVFYISASVYAFGTIFYGLFGSGEIQPWAATDATVFDVKSSEDAEKDNRLNTT